MLMFISDTVEYGELKFGQRNDSVTLSLQSFVNKIGSAVASAIVGFTYIQANLRAANSPADVTPQALLLFKFMMLILPLILIISGYIIYRKKYRIDEVYYADILKQLEERKIEKETHHD